MSRKLVLTTFFMAVLIGTLGLSSVVQRVEASGTIYIRADGSIDPPTAPITTVDNVTYTFTGNIYNSIVIERDNIVVDGVGYTVQGTGSGSGISLSKRTNVTIWNVGVKAFLVGIYLDNSSENCISENDITGNSQGIYVYGSNEPPETGSWNNTIVGNKLTKNGGGILLEEAKFNNVFGNDISENHGNVDYPLRPGGIYIFLNSLGNIVSGNNINDNERYGIYFHYCTALTPEWINVVRGNNIINNGAGIETYHGDGIGIFENNIKNNDDGLNLSPGHHVTGFHNNFINNAHQAVAHSKENIWDDGYPSGGNYWSDYNGTDTNSDGLGDTPYVIDADNQDRYPLTHPWSPLPVHNMNNGLGYATIQEAINANETSDGHAIFVEAGTYYENVVVNKTISLLGEKSENTIVDGDSRGAVLTVTANNTRIGEMTIRNSGGHWWWDKYCGILLDHSFGVAIYHNNLIGNAYGFYLVNSSENMLMGNNITRNEFGVYLTYSDGNHVTDNQITEHSDNGIYIVYSSNNTLIGNDLIDNRQSIYIESISNNTFTNNSIRNSTYGVIGWYLFNNAFTCNCIADCSVPMTLQHCFNNTLLSNNIEDNQGTGISLVWSSDNIFMNNSIINNPCGISFVYDSSNNSLRTNTLANNKQGMLFETSSNNKVHHNNFTNNMVQAYDIYSTNVWDDGYPSGGNYWSGYNGTDQYQGSYQNETGSDGIGDSPYVIDANNIDRYPLKPYVALFGDVNGDGVINMKDVSVAVAAFNSFSSTPRWNPDVDLNQDGRVDMRDIAAIVLNFNKHE